mgnify:CR=1 FL=1
MISYSSGDVFKGIFSENEPKRGILNLHNGDEFDGFIREGEWSGEGSYRYASGDYYSGHFKGGKRHGLGKMIFSNGDVYEGMWQSGQKHGKGRYRWKN